MNEFEQFAITAALSLVLSTVKNPAHAAALKTQLLGVAAQIQEAYGIVPPTTSAS